MSEEAFFIPDFTARDFFQNFFEGITYPLTSEFWIAEWVFVLLSSFYFIFGSMIVLHVADPGEPKRRAWVLSTLSSFAMTALACPYAFYAGSLLMSEGLEATTEFAMSNTKYSECITVWFLVFLIFDMINAALWYKNHMEVLTGWIHHIVYALFLPCALKLGWSSSLAIMMVEEIPTFILDLGMLYPNFRSEYGFGISFFILRIAFHLGGTIFVFVRMRHYTFAWVPALLAFFLHVSWFIKWTKRQIRLSKSFGIKSKTEATWGTSSPIVRAISTTGMTKGSAVEIDEHDRQMRQLSLEGLLPESQMADEDSEESLIAAEKAASMRMRKEGTGRGIL